MTRRYWRIGLAGVVAGIVFALLSGLTFYALGILPGILFNPRFQSPKVLAVMLTLEPLPVMQRAPYIIVAGWSVIIIGYAFLFNHISVLWPQSNWTRMWRLALLIWFFSLLFFEFQGPYNLLGEPLPLVSLELLFWAICAIGASVVIVAMTPTQDA